MSLSPEVWWYRCLSCTPGLLLANSFESGGPRSRCSVELLFLQHCLTSSNSTFTLLHKATKICSATCDRTHTYRPALGPGLLGEALCMAICGLFCTAPSCLKPADSSHFTRSEFCSLSRKLGRCRSLLGLQLSVLWLGNCSQAERGGNSGTGLVSYASFWNCSLICVLLAV